MKRTRKAEPGELEWLKTGGGSFTLKIGGKSKMIKPGQKFFAKVEEIPVGFRDVLVPVRPKELKDAIEGTSSVDIAEVEYTLKHRSGGYYHVYDADGKQVTEKALKKVEAEELISSLT